MPCPGSFAAFPDPVGAYAYCPECSLPVTLIAAPFEGRAIVPVHQTHVGSEGTHKPTCDLAWPTAGVDACCTCSHLTEPVPYIGEAA